MKGRSAVIRDRIGRKLCEIEPPHRWDLVGEWVDVTPVVRWAWLQTFSIAVETNARLKRNEEITGQTRFHCLMCGQTGMAPILRWGRLPRPFRNSLIQQTDVGRGWGRRTLWFECLNKECKMYKVHLPAKVLREIDGMPYPRPGGIWFPDGTSYIVPSGDPYVIFVSSEGGYTCKDV